MFRELQIPGDTPGSIFLHSMPGRDESFNDVLLEILRLKFHKIISLTSLEEINRNSPEYLHAIKAHELPCDFESFPIPDFGVPGDMECFGVYVEQLTKRLLAGDRILIHCGAGIGRTGTFACCLLIAMHVPKEKSLMFVREAGSGPENSKQEDFIAQFASIISQAKEAPTDKAKL